MRCTLWSRELHTEPFVLGGSIVSLATWIALVRSRPSRAPCLVDQISRPYKDPRLVCSRLVPWVSVFSSPNLFKCLVPPHTSIHTTHPRTPSSYLFVVGWFLFLCTPPPPAPPSANSNFQPSTQYLRLYIAAHRRFICHNGSSCGQDLEEPQRPVDRSKW